MKTTIALVGRPNVGKSTLFNRLTKTRDALVADLPGLTRDRHYGHGRVGHKPYLVIDTGGFEPVVDSGIMFEMARQTLQAIDEADAIIFIVDARTGLTQQDKMIANRLRKMDQPVLLAVNKAEGMNRHIVAAEFFELALGDPITFSASHGDGVYHLIERVLENFETAEVVDEDLSQAMSFAIVGRPNVGKSTLVNAILGEDRVIAFDQPGTTRDSIAIQFENEGQAYTIIDTAGVRRRSKVNEAIEKFSVIKTMQSIEAANVVVLVLDASLDISEQDAHIAQFILESGRALVVAINKWDEANVEQKENIKKILARKLHFLDFAKHHYISALKGTGVKEVLNSVQLAYKAAMIKLSTPKLMRALALAVERQEPPRSGLIRPKLKYAHQGGTNPPVIIVHGNALEKIPANYWRYLEKSFLRLFKLQGTPLQVQYKKSVNPFEGKASAKN